MLDIPSSPPSTKTALRLWDRMLTLKVHLQDGMGEGMHALAALELTVPQAMVLARLVQVGPLTMSEVQAVSGRSQSATSTLVAGLERRGFVSRRADKADARRVLAKATAKGRRAMEQVDGLRKQALADLVERLPSELVGRIDEVLADVQTALELSDKNSSPSVNEPSLEVPR